MHPKPNMRPFITARGPAGTGCESGVDQDPACRADEVQ